MLAYLQSGPALDMRKMPFRAHIEVRHLALILNVYSVICGKREIYFSYFRIKIQNAFYINIVNSNGRKQHAYLPTYQFLNIHIILIEHICNYITYISPTDKKIKTCFNLFEAPSIGDRRVT